MQPWREKIPAELWKRKLVFTALTVFWDPRSGSYNTGFHTSTPFFGKAGTKQDCHLKWPKLTSCLAYHAHGLLIQFNDWQLCKREKEHALTNGFKKSKRIILGCHHHTLLGGSLSWVSLAFNSWLFSISHVTKSVKEHEDRDMKHVHWAMLVDTEPMLLLCSADSFRVTFPSHHMPACNDVCTLKFSSTKGLHGVLHFKSRWKNSLFPQ